MVLLSLSRFSLGGMFDLQALFKLNLELVEEKKRKINRTKMNMGE